MWQALGCNNKGEALDRLDKQCKSATNQRHRQKLKQQQALEQRAHQQQQEAQQVHQQMPAVTATPATVPTLR
jgi:hypothetical protein